MLVVLAVVIVVSLVINFQTSEPKTVVVKDESAQRDIAQKALEIEALKQKIAELEQKASTPVVVEKVIEKEVSPVIKVRQMPVLAYSRVTQKGVVGSVEVSLVPGKGDILIDVRPFNSIAVQQSAEKSVKAAMKEANILSLRDKDIKIKFSIGAEAVGGESAGIAIALATLALLTDAKIKKTVAATGTMDEFGNVGKVGGILQKAEAISKKGVKLLLIPRGTGEVIATTPQYFVDETGKRVGKGPNVQRPINAIKEARSRWNLELQQVSTLSGAKQYVLE